MKVLARQQRKSVDLTIAIPEQEKDKDHDEQNLFSHHSKNILSKSTRNLQSITQKKNEGDNRESHLYESVTAFNALQTPRD